jgi:hypothetical protein
VHVHPEAANAVDEDEYRNPWQVPEGPVPIDLFAEADLWPAPKIKKST